MSTTVMTRPDSIVADLDLEQSPRVTQKREPTKPKSKQILATSAVLNDQRALQKQRDAAIAAIPFTRIAVTSIAWVTLVLAVVTVVATTMLSGDLATGLGTAGGAIIWVGPAFGVMTAGSRISARIEAIHAAADPLQT